MVANERRIELAPMLLTFPRAGLAQMLGSLPWTTRVLMFPLRQLPFALSSKRLLGRR